MGVNLGGFDVAVAEQVLDGPDVGAGFEQMGGKGMAEGVAGSGFGQAGLDDGLVDRPLEQGLVHVVAALLAGVGVFPAAGLREHPLPRPILTGVDVFAVQGFGQFHQAPAVGEVLLMELADGGQVIGQVGLEAGRQHGDAILGPLALADQNLVALEVDVLDPQVETLLEAHAGAVKDAGRQGLVALELGQNPTDLVPTENQRQPAGLLGPNDIAQTINRPVEHLAVEEEQSGQGLVLGRRTDLGLDRQIGQEAVDVAGVQVGHGHAGIGGEELFNPLAIGGAGARTVVAGVESFGVVVEKIV